MNSEVFLSILIPCFNEEKRIQNGYSKLSSYLSTASYSYEIIGINDGSKDNTLNILKRISETDANFKVVSYDKNKGKGGAVREGILASKGQIVCFIDADMACSFNAIEKAINLISEGDTDIVISNRRMKGSVEKVPLYRKAVSFVNRVITFLIVGLNYSDTQSGFKAFRRDVAHTIASKQKILGFSFDVEYLYIAKLLNYSVKQISVVYINDVSNSSVRVIRDSIKFFSDYFVIRHNKNEYIGTDKK